MDFIWNESPCRGNALHLAVLRDELREVKARRPFSGSVFVWGSRGVWGCLGGGISLLLGNGSFLVVLVFFFGWGSSVVWGVAGFCFFVLGCVVLAARSRVLFGFGGHSDVMVVLIAGPFFFFSFLL